MFGIEEIKKILPHREPFLMVDKVCENIPGKRTIAIKAVSGNEWFFKGHFEKIKVMPGVLIIEAIAQTGGIALMTLEGMEGKLALLARVKSAKFSKKVVPGDTLRIETTITDLTGVIGKGNGTVTVDGDVAAKCELVFVIADAGDEQII